MTDTTGANLNFHKYYSNKFGVVAGYMPSQKEHLDAWLADVKKKALESDEDYLPPVQAFQDLIQADGIVRMYVTQMIEQAKPHMTKDGLIGTVEELLKTLNYVMSRAPEYNPIPKKQNFFPMSALFVYMMMTNAGEAAFRYVAINAAIRNILQAWCRFLDSEASTDVLNTGTNGWLSESAYRYNKLEEFIIPDRQAPHWGFTSFNDYFHRQIKPKCRPVAGVGDETVVVSANDGTVYKIAHNVKKTDRFWIKGQPYSLSNMLADNPLVDEFVGGDVFQSFLSGADYHRWHSPVQGTVVHAQVIDGLMFSDAESAGPDPTAGTYSQGYEASVNTRGLVIVDSGNSVLGKVCVMPIGITEISSVTLEVQANDRVNKGQELGYFSYGGSSLCLVFQPGAINRFTVPSPPPGGNPDDGPSIQVNAQIAVANL